MRIRPEQIGSHLKRNLADIYVIYGDEPLQREESLDAIRSAARAAGYNERIVLHVDSDFDWSELQVHTGNLSLFAERKLIDLRLLSGTPGKNGGSALVHYTSNPLPDLMLLLSCARLERRSTTTKWFKALEKAGNVVEARPVPLHDLPRWVGARATARGVKITPAAAEVLAERSEGNLFACAQEIDKLRLLTGGGEITVDEVIGTVAESARFGAFDLVDAALAGDGVRAIRILRIFQAERIEPIQILGSLTWAIRGVGSIATRIEGGARLDDVLRSGFGAWWGKKRVLEQALARMPGRYWIRLLGVSEGVDRILKGTPLRSGAIVRWSRTDAWTGLERLALAMCKVRLPRAAPYT